MSNFSSNPVNLTPENTVTLTESAIARVKNLLQIKKNPNLKFRVSILGGGCSGYEYHFDLSEEQQANDHVFTQDVTLLIDPVSMRFLKGSFIDYEETLQSARFVVKNPNAFGTCGCGTSFSIKKEK